MYNLRLQRKPYRENNIVIDQDNSPKREMMRPQAGRVRESCPPPEAWDDIIQEREIL